MILLSNLLNIGTEIKGFGDLP